MKQYIVFLSNAVDNSFYFIFVFKHAARVFYSFHARLLNICTYKKMNSFRAFLPTDRSYPHE